jgi:starch synthase
MKILFAASEIAPLAQTGGLAAVMRSLPIALQQNGVETAIVMPKYRHIEAEIDDLARISIPVEEKFIKGRIQQTTLPDSDIKVFLIEQDDYYDRDGLYTEQGRDYPDNLERYTFFCRAVLDLVTRNIFKADIIHANDWQTALIPVYIKTLFKDHELINKIKTLYTIHNLAYQGIFPIFHYPILGMGLEHFNINELEFYNQINLMKGGIVFADFINTVSPTYADEIQTIELGYGLDGIIKKNNSRLRGIVNCIDYDEWSPSSDSSIASMYNVDTVVEGKTENKEALLKEFGLPVTKDRKPLLGMVSRITQQKGCDLLIEILPELINNGAQVIVLGTGDLKLEEQLLALKKKYPESFGVVIDYDTRLSHFIEAGSDIFLMPSRFEPCGLNQMYSLRYGSIPVVHSIGGLADTVTDIHKSDTGNGFTFDQETSENFLEACTRAMKHFEDPAAWKTLMQRAMRIDFSWNRSAQDYIDIYKSLLDD